jgi:cell division transport system permease protein
MEVWTLIHQDRIKIMSLLGAAFWMKSATLYKTIIIDSIISATIASFASFLLTKNSSFISMLEKTGLQLPKFDLINDTLILTGIGSGISIVLVTLLIFKQRK